MDIEMHNDNKGPQCRSRENSETINQSILVEREKQFFYE